MANSTTRIALSTQLLKGDAKFFQATDKTVGMIRLIDLLNAMNSGGGCNGPLRPGSVSVSIDEQGTTATATATLAGVLAADTITIGNIVFTAVNGGPVGNQFDMSGTDTAKAVSLVATINANTSLSPYLVATSALGVVTITTIGTALSALGNLIQLSSSNAGRIAVVNFTGGVTDAGAVTYGL